MTVKKLLQTNKIILLNIFLLVVFTFSIQAKVKLKDNQFEMSYAKNAWQGEGKFNGKVAKITIQGGKLDARKLNFAADSYVFINCKNGNTYAIFEKDMIINGDFYAAQIESNIVTFTSVQKAIGSINFQFENPNIISNLSMACYLMGSENKMQIYKSNKIPVGKYKLHNLQAEILAKDDKIWNFSATVAKTPEIEIIENKALAYKLELPMVNVKATDIKKRLAKKQKIQTEFEQGTEIELKLFLSSKDGINYSLLRPKKEKLNPLLVIKDSQAKVIFNKALVPG